MNECVCKGALFGVCVCECECECVRVCAGERESSQVRSKTF